MGGFFTFSTQSANTKKQKQAFFRFKIADNEIKNIGSSGMGVVHVIFSLSILIARNFLIILHGYQRCFRRRLLHTDRLSEELSSEDEESESGILVLCPFRRGHTPIRTPT